MILYSSRISGFAVPLRDENADFFRKIILQLFKMESFCNFAEEHYRIVFAFLNKDVSLTKEMWKAML